eukprot:GHVP01036737.1.p1 GENE.GHVP01036737.1~~GHVP01036737.1.p1  ORF type:complete len:123 (-),score=7.61 GHVP01036737.1:1175-1543(-)
MNPEHPPHTLSKMPPNVLAAIQSQIQLSIIKNILQPCSPSPNASYLFTLPKKDATSLTPLPCPTYSTTFSHLHLHPTSPLSTSKAPFSKYPSIPPHQSQHNSTYYQLTRLLPHIQYPGLSPP